MSKIARFFSEHRCTAAANVYPYLTYSENPGDTPLSYVTFQRGTTAFSDNNSITYTDLFDAMIDALYTAMEKAGAPGVRVVVSESGWPHMAVSMETYDKNLINHVGNEMPKRLGLLKTYIFTLCLVQWPGQVAGVPRTPIYFSG